MHKRLIRIHGQKIWLNAEKSFELADTNLAEGSLTFRRNHDIYWEVMFDEDSFNSITRTLTMVVSNYHPLNTSSFDAQPVRDYLHKLSFKAIHWNELEPLLSSYKPGPLRRSGAVIDKKDESIPYKQSPKNAFVPFSVRPTVEPKPVEPKTIIHRDTVSIYYEDAEFHDDHISFTQRFYWHHQSITFKIDNPWLKKEYDYIRFYFARAMDNNPSFEVNVEVTITDGRITDKKATSREIDKIDSGIIDSIKYHRVINLVKAPSMRKKRSLFTTEDIFQNFEKENAGNLFKQTGEELLHYIMTNRKVRNEEQLKCLSGELHSRVQKLRFTLNPFFGFFILPRRKE